MRANGINKINKQNLSKSSRLYLALIINLALYQSMPQKKLMQERQFAHAPSSARVIAFTYLKLHMLSKICLSEIDSFLLLKHVNCLIFDKTG